jgi:hypothetical protein
MSKCDVATWIQSAMSKDGVTVDPTVFASVDSLIKDVKESNGIFKATKRKK